MPNTLFQIWYICSFPRLYLFFFNFEDVVLLLCLFLHLFFFQKLMTATVVIPNAGKQIFTSVKDIIEGLKHFNKDPKGAISAVTSGSLT